MAAETPRKGSQEPRRPVGLLFELEGSAVEGRRILFDLCRRGLKEREIELTVPVFLRYSSRPLVARALGEVLDTMGKKRFSAEKMEAELNEAVADAFSSDKLKLAPGMAKLMDRVAEAGVRLGAVTALPGLIAEGLLSRLGLEERQVGLFRVDPDDDVFPAADAWLKLAKSIGVPPLGCTVLATSGTSCKSALSARMRCVACADEMTECQDFSGSDALIERLNDDGIREILATLNLPDRA